MLPFIDPLFEPLAKVAGASVDEIKFIVSFLLSYPLALILKRIPDAKPWQKNVFIIAVSTFYLIGLFDLWAGVRTILYASAGTYAIAYYIDGTFMPWIAFAFLMGHMSINQIERQILNDPGVIDITAAQMVLVMKLSGFAWNVHDGRLKPELLNDHQKSRAIYEMPGFLDYTGYVLFFPAFFAGPAFEYNDYRRWIETTMFDVDPSTKGPATRPGHRIPRSGTPAAIKAFQGLVYLFLYTQLAPFYNVPLVLSDKYASYSLVKRVFILYALGMTSRLKYYAVWSLTEGSCILSGLGYAGMSPDPPHKPLWNRVENIYPWGVETAQNSRGYLENWNKNTNNWLRNYVYLRVTPRGQKPGFRASLATFSTSAFWHGFYPGYYLTFILGAFIQTVAKNFRRYVRPFFMTPDGKSGTKYKIYYDIASWLVTQVGFSFATLPFVTLGFYDSLVVWSRVYFYGVVGIAASMAFFASPAKGYLIKKLKARNHPHVRKRVSEETRDLPTLGLPSDPGREIDEAIEEVKTEVEARKRRGSRAVEMPTGKELREIVERKLGRKLWVDKEGELRVEEKGEVKKEL